MEGGWVGGWMDGGGGGMATKKDLYYPYSFPINDKSPSTDNRHKRFNISEFS